MKLRAVEVLILQGSAEQQAVARCGDGVLTKLRVVGVNVVDVFAALDTIEKFRIKVVNAVPTHVRNFLCRRGRKTSHSGVENSHAFSIAFL